ncbi:MAG: catabolite control protein A [Lactobacillales bacterium]|jgi:LacI family transcriptional regulator|nr:catabolite control protein A [Lactobacillales bacterium]
MNKPSITIYDVAREAGVSMATVSRVVNGNNNVKPTTRKKVLDVINQLNYRPNAVARGLANKKTTTIGVVIPDISNAFFSSLALGIDDIATMYKYNILLANSDSEEKKEINVLNTLLARQVDGVIFMGRQITQRIRKELLQAKTPIVLAGTLDTKQQIPSVNINYEAASFEATSFLAKKDNQQIAFISGPLVEPVNIAYFNGYKKALIENKLPYQEGLIFEADYLFHKGGDLAKRIKNANINACYVTDDELAIGLSNGLLDLGIDIPDEIKIITSHNSTLTEFARPRISSITQPLYDLGAVSMRLLTKLINQEGIEEKNVILPHGFEEKGSTSKN